MNRLSCQSNCVKGSEVAVMDFDDDDFDDLLAGVDDFPDSSQESLTAGAAKLAMPSSSTQDGDHYSEAHPWESTPSIESSGANVPSVPQAGPPPAIQWEIHKPLPVQDRIQRVFDGIAHTLSTKSGELSVVLRTKTKSAHAASCLRRITFPGKSAEEAWRFSMTVPKEI